MNTNKILTAFLIMFPVTVGLVIGGQYLINKFTNVMLLTKLVPFIQKYEGGLSRDPADSASRNPAPWSYNGKTGWHTNKGVTYSAFASLAKKAGYEASAKNFFEMPNDIWYKILEVGYMSAFPLNKIPHLPRIQAVITTWAWGSGVGGAEKYLASFQRQMMGINDASITPTEIVENFRRNITPLNEREWFNKLCDRREQDFRKMATFGVHGRGWLNRLAEFRKLFN